MTAWCDGSQTVILGADALVSGNIMKVDTLYIGGPNVLIEGNFEDTVHTLIVGPGAELQVNGSVQVESVILLGGGRLVVDGKLIATAEITLGVDSFLSVDGDLECPGAQTHQDPTSQVEVNGTNACAPIDAS